MVGVLASWALVAGQEFSVDVEVAFKVGKAFMDAPPFHVVLDAGQGIVFLFHFGDDCSPVDLQLCMSFMVAAVALDFCIGCGVFKGTGHLSQSVVGPPSRLE